MRFYREFLWIFLVIITTLVIGTGCTPVSTGTSDIPDAAKPDTLRVGVSANAPPLIYKNNNKLTGLEVALAFKLGDYLKKKIVFIEVPWDEQLNYLNDGKTDIVMSGMTITQKRSYLADFTTPYMRSGQIMLVRMEDQGKFRGGVGSLLNRNYRIGTVPDTISDFFITSTVTKPNVFYYKKSQLAVNALIRKEIDVFVYDAPVVCYYAAKHQSDKLVPILSMGTEEYLGWAVRKADNVLLEGANAFLDSLNQQDLLEPEIKQWIPYLYR
jgi:ABC-type amino acid transport substrate-binding protein